MTTLIAQLGGSATSNYVVDCDILNPARAEPDARSVDTCGALTGNALNFGKALPA